ncbi:MAG: hypothetical protein E3J30_00685 [Anaerolineales bacterium]|nr:MAG: hypothetical protein E3J30_00685 [Anaerolineales bacterium]
MSLSQRLGTIVVITWLAGACTRPAPVRELPVDVNQTTDQVLADPSSTAPPSATNITTPTAISTLTPTPGLTITPTPPPLSPDDPRYGLNLAAPHYWDDFSSNLTWVGPNFDGAMNVWEDGRLRATDFLADKFLWWSTTIPDVDAGDLYVEVTAEVGECSGKDAIGLAVRVDPDHRNSGYTLEFSCDGSYRIRKLVAGTIQTLLEWTSSDSILSGSDTTNVLGFLARGTTLTVFANGEVLSSIEASAFFKGNFGLFTDAASTPGLTVYFDDFKLWYINP